MNSIREMAEHRIESLVLWKRTHTALRRLARSQRDERCKTVWKYLDSCNKKLFFGGEQASCYCNQFKQCFEIQDGFVKIGGLYIPAPSADDIEVWNYEFMDILAPYVFYDNDDYRYEELIPAFNEGPYEIDSDVCIQKGDVVVDCGANLGMFSALASAKGASIVYAFEPLKRLAETSLAGTAKRNPNISVVNCAVSDFIGTGEFIIEQNIGGSGLREQSIAADHGNETITVDITTLDDFCSQNQIEKIDFIKCNIEGAERNMLRGAQNVLRYLEPKLSICTYHHPEDPQLLEEIIRSANPNYRIKHQYLKLYAYVKKDMERGEPLSEEDRERCSENSERI